MPARKKDRPVASKIPAVPTQLQQVWDRLLSARIPLLDTLALSRLEHDMQAGDPRATAILARSLGADGGGATAIKLTVALEKVAPQPCIDAIWAEWMRSRSKRLLGVLQSIQKPAAQPVEARAFSLLMLGRIKQLEDASPDLVLPLIHACDEADETIAASARHVIGHLRKEDALDILCTYWAQTRSRFIEGVIRTAGYMAQHPVEVHVLTALKLNQPDRIGTSSAEVVAPLILASRDADTEIANRADYLLRHALSGAALTEFCLRWSRDRDASLEAILLQNQLLPRQPQPLRLLCALKLGNLEVARNCPPRSLDTLLAACQDQDDTIRANARAALRNLRGKESQAALCETFLVNGNEEARDAAVEAGYLPDALEQRALFLFLTAQWPAYEALDFDQRMMRAIYDTAAPELRQRMARTVQAAGRIDFLTILTGADNRQRANRMDDAETSLVIQMLQKNHDWQKLWLLALELPLARSVEIFGLLAAHNWQPRPSDEMALYRQLVEITSQPMQTVAAGMAALLPAAVPLATLKIRGRVNDISFAPGSPLLALATSSRKVVLWNYQKGQVHQVITGFAHSVGKAAFLPDGQLVCAERTTGEARCEIIGIYGQQPYVIGWHDASVTALMPLPDGLLLTCGRDHKIILWDVAQRQKIAELKLTNWPRCAAISPDGRMVALVSDRVQLLELPSLNPLDNLPAIYSKDHNTRAGVARCASFDPAGSDLLTGQVNGQVTHYRDVVSTRRRQKQLLDSHSASLTGLEFLPRHPLLLSMSSEGDLHFTSWPAGTRFSQVKTTLANLSSLKISSDGNFIATGSGEDAFTLWDVRTLDLPAIFALPLPNFRTEHLAAVESLVDVEEIPAPVRNSLRYLQALLQFRYRFDIQIGEISHIQPGEFDILVDEAGGNSGYNG